MARTPVRHKSCGGITGWYVGDADHPSARVQSAEYERLDGTRPQTGERFSERCVCCGERINGFADMQRRFEEAIPS